MINPDQVAEMLYPAATSTGKPGPIPTVVPTPTHYQLSGETGHRTLWVLFAGMTLSAGIFALLSWNVPTSKRIYHVTTTLFSLVSALTYFAMASGQASSLSCHAVRDHHSHVPDTFHDECRQVYWARYVDWALTTPLILLNLCLLAGVDGAHTLMAIVADLVMVLAGLFAAYGTDGTAQKWGWFTISCLGYLFVVWHVGLQGTRMVQNKGGRVAKLWASVAIYSLAVWAAYPIIWGIATLSHKTSVDTEILIYAVLDILAKPVFGIWLLISHRAIAESNIDLGGYWSQGLSAEGRIRIGDEE
jgi:bacteriorhodopsin